MIVQVEGHWSGDPAVACGSITITADSQSEARRLAPLARVLSCAEQRARLLELAERVEAESAPAAELAGC